MCVGDGGGGLPGHKTCFVHNIWCTSTNEEDKERVFRWFWGGDGRLCTQTRVNTVD